MLVTVTDTAYPQKTETSTFTASISRNENKPKFEQGEYRATINDRFQLGQEVATVVASDEDNVSVFKSKQKSNCLLLTPSYVRFYYL